MHEKADIGALVEQRTFIARLAGCFGTGAVKGLRMTLWLLSFMAPLSFGVAALLWTGVLGHVAKWIEPGFRLVGLPGETAIAFLTGAFLNCYSGIAAMGPIPLDARQITILAVMILISHNLPVESVVQHKAGSSAGPMIALRLAASVVAAVALNLALPVEAGPQRVSDAAAAASAPVGLGAALGNWAADMAWLMGKIVLFVTGIMVLQRILEEFNVMAPLSRLLAWPLQFLGLPRRTAFLWVVANTLGLAYGAAVIVEETRSGKLNPEEIEIINRSVGICHSLLEDTLLFVAVGAWAFWIVLPRVLLAAAAAWGYRAWRRLRAVPARDR